jgi:[protein-PII] uridylyltransferase
VGTRERRERSNANDVSLIDLFHAALTFSHVPEEKIAMVAVGGYGRGEMSPGSDLDILFIHANLAEEDLTLFVKRMLDPLWRDGKQIDYSVRTRRETHQVSFNDVKVALGLLDIRYLAGNKALFEAVSQDAAISWKKNIRKFLPSVQSSINERTKSFGELAFLLEPDLKESRGGLRDISLLRALVLSDYVTIPLERVAEAESFIWQVRDVLQDLSGRSRNQLLLTEQDAVAEMMGLVDADDLLLRLSKAARSVDYTMQLAWHCVSLKERRSRFRPSSRMPIARGLELFNNEIVLTKGYDVKSDPGILFRMAAVAAQRGKRISLATISEISNNVPEVTGPWPEQMREDLVSFIGAGEMMINIFESLDQENLISRWFPEWEHLRFLPQRNVLHHHTVDRHMLETAARAAALTRQVHRPDLLLIGALFHDIGKGYLGRDHSEYGAELMYPLALRMGFSSKDSEVLASMVKFHLLLPTVATRRDLDDAATIDHVHNSVQNAELLELLHALSIADGEATGRSAWSPWKAQLVKELVSRTHSAMKGITLPGPPGLTEEQLTKARRGLLEIGIVEREDSLEIEIIAPDSLGLLAAISAVLTVLRLEVRTARTRTVGEAAVTQWIVNLDVNVPIPSLEGLTDSIQRALSGTEDLQVRIAERIRIYKRTAARSGLAIPPPVVSAITQISSESTIIEVRMHDQPGLLYTITSALAHNGVDIQGAIVSTLGAEAFDTLYVTDRSGAPLTLERAERVASDLQSLLTSQE